MKRYVSIILILVIGATALVTGIGAYKLNHGLYNALDLAIYTNVLANTTQGNILYSDIQQTNYLGDHVELLLLPLSVFYRLWSSPLLLVLLQALCLFGSTLIFFLICKRYTSPKNSFLLSLLYLFNPLLWNAALFEFHLLTFAVPLLLLLWYFYVQKRLLPYLLVAILALLVREDVAIVLLGFGLLAFVEKRTRRWWLSMLLVGGAWFATALVISRIAGSASYKFTTYYSWLWESDLATLATGLFSIQHLVLLGGLAALFFFLPLFSIRLLLPASGILAQLFFARFDPSTIFQTHYPVLLVPLLATAGCVALMTSSHRWIQYVRTTEHRPLFVVIAGVIGIALFVGVTSTPDAFRTYTNTHPQLKINQQIQRADTLYASYGSLPLFAQNHVYTFHYAVPGTKQFSEEPYLVGVTPDYAVVDVRDFTFLELAMQSTRVYGDRELHAQRLRSLLNTYELSSQHWPLFTLAPKTSGMGFGELLAHTDDPPALSDPHPLGPLTLDAWAYNRSTLEQSFTLYLTPISLQQDTYYQITISQNNNSFTAPLAWNLFTPQELQGVVNLVMTIPLPFSLDPHDSIHVSLGSREGAMELSGLKSLEPQFSVVPLAETEVTISSLTSYTDVVPE